MPGAVCIPTQLVSRSYCRAFLLSNLEWHGWLLAGRGGHRNLGKYYALWKSPTILFRPPSKSTKEPEPLKSRAETFGFSSHSSLPLVSTSAFWYKSLQMKGLGTAEVTGSKDTNGILVTGYTLERKSLARFSQLFEDVCAFNSVNEEQSSTWKVLTNPTYTVHMFLPCHYFDCLI